MKNKKMWHRKTLLLPLIMMIMAWGCGCSRRPEITAVGFVEEYGSEAVPGDLKEMTETSQKSTLGEITKMPQASALEEVVKTSQESVPGGIMKMSQNGETETAGQEDGQAAEIVVHVCGAVKYPGIYHLPESARVYEAVEAAGGFREDADSEWLNQAALLQDGEKLKIPTAEETSLWKTSGMTEPEAFFGAGEPGTQGGDGQEEERVNLNTACREELMTLPGIGEAKADAVLAYREEHGKFQKIEDIMKISGIKDAVFLKIKDRITV